MRTYISFNPGYFFLFLVTLDGILYEGIYVVTLGYVLL